MTTYANDPGTVPIRVILREWTRIGCTGFGGPPAHIALLRTLCVTERAWLSAEEFEDAIAATNLLPGPASTQLAIYCAWRLRGSAGAILGGLCFIIPGLILILALSALFLAALPLTLALAHLWQAGVLALAALSLFVLRRGVVTTLLAAAALGIIAAGEVAECASGRGGLCFFL